MTTSRSAETSRPRAPSVAAVLDSGPESKPVRVVGGWVGGFGSKALTEFGCCLQLTPTRRSSTPVARVRQRRSGRGREFSG